MTSACKFYSDNPEKEEDRQFFIMQTSHVLILFLSLSSSICNRLIYWFSHILLSSSLFFMIWLSFNGLFILFLSLFLLSSASDPCFRSLLQDPWWLLSCKSKHDSTMSERDKTWDEWNYILTQQNKTNANETSIHLICISIVMFRISYCISCISLTSSTWDGWQLLHNCRFCLFTLVLCVSSSLKGRNVNMSGAWEHNTTYSLISWLIQWL